MEPRNENGHTRRFLPLEVAFLVGGRPIGMVALTIPADTYDVRRNSVHPTGFEPVTSGSVGHRW
jgi:hypothetical protein